MLRCFGCKARSSKPGRTPSRVEAKQFATEESAGSFTSTSGASPPGVLYSYYSALSTPASTPLTAEALAQHERQLREASEQQHRAAASPFARSAPAPDGHAADPMSNGRPPSGSATKPAGLAGFWGSFTSGSGGAPADTRTGVVDGIAGAFSGLWGPAAGPATPVKSDSAGDLNGHAPRREASPVGSVLDDEAELDPKEREELERLSSQMSSEWQRAGPASAVAKNLSSHKLAELEEMSASSSAGSQSLPRGQAAAAGAALSACAEPNSEAWLAEYDAGWLAFLGGLYGARGAGALAEVPLLPVAPWNRQAGYLGHLTEQQAAALKAMRDSFPESVRFHTDHDILRFLRAREFDLEQARTMYSCYCHVYRKRLLVSPLPVVRPTHGEPFSLAQLEAALPPRPAPLTRRFHTIMDYFLHAMVFGTDTAGRPVLYLRVVDMMRRGMTEHVTVRERLAMQAASNELNRALCHMASAARGYHVEEVVQVLDLGGLTPYAMLTHVRSIDNKREWEHNMDYNPETAGRIVIINAPFGSGMVWRAASVFMPSATRSKVTILSSAYQQPLRELIGAANLPSCYGGTVPFEWPQHHDVALLAEARA